jgi:hypothetical protein
VELYRWLPSEAVKILLVLFLSFLIGLEREEHKTEDGRFAFGSVRTFPLIGLIGYSIALLSGTQLLPVTLGFLVIGGFLSLSIGTSSPPPRPRASHRRCPDLPLIW